MMRLTCPTCGRTTPADNINIQQMTAVCPHCHTVFEFDIRAEKPKRRKVKQPEAMQVNEDAGVLELAFHTNWRMERSMELSNRATLALIFTLMTITIVTGAEIAPASVPIVTALLAASAYYGIGLLLYNRTHITMDQQQVRVSRQPLPTLFSQERVINLHDVVRFEFSETSASVEGEYDTPRYSVWAVRADQRRDLVVTDLVGDYPQYIVQQLTQHLAADDALASTRLQDIAESMTTNIAQDERDEMTNLRSQ